MNDLMKALIFALVGSVILIIVFREMMFRDLSPIKAAFIVFLYPLVFETIMVLIQEEKTLEAMCLGIFLSIIFGTSTYIFGKALQKRLQKKQFIIHQNQ